MCPHNRCAAPPPADSQADAKPAPQKLHGFALVEEQYVPEYASKVLLYRHEKTGAQLMSVINSDENKTFGVTFRCAPAHLQLRWLAEWIESSGSSRGGGGRARRLCCCCMTSRPLARALCAAGLRWPTAAACPTSWSTACCAAAGSIPSRCGGAGGGEEHGWLEGEGEEEGEGCTVGKDRRQAQGVGQEHVGGRGAECGPL